jgi:hypothetical protein
MFFVNSGPNFADIVLRKNQNLDISVNLSDSDNDDNNTDTDKKNESTIVDKKKIKHNINKIKERTERLRDQSKNKCLWYKYISMIHNITMIIEGCLVTLISSLNYLSGCAGNYNIALIAIGVIITAQKSIQTIFNFDRKSVEFKKVNIKSKRLLRELNDINLDDDEINIKIKKITEQLDNLEFDIFLDGIDDK